jgi:hypothetical protein
MRKYLLVVMAAYIGNSSQHVTLVHQGARLHPNAAFALTDNPSVFKSVKLPTRRVIAFPKISGAKIVS